MKKKHLLGMRLRTYIHAVGLFRYLDYTCCILRLNSIKDREQLAFALWRTYFKYSQLWMIPYWIRSNFDFHLIKRTDTCVIRLHCTSLVRTVSVPDLIDSFYFMGNLSRRSVMFSALIVICKWSFGIIFLNLKLLKSN